jgi:hypothetical protein
MLQQYNFLVQTKHFFCFNKSIIELRDWMDTYHALKVGDWAKYPPRMPFIALFKVGGMLGPSLTYART